MTQWQGNKSKLSKSLQRWLATPPPPEPNWAVMSQACSKPDCHTIIVGTSAEELAIRMAAHRRRHGA